jgi:hypothetical protein
VAIHNGGTIGFRSAMICDMTSGLGAVVMVNGPAWPPGDHGIAAEEIALAILKELWHAGDPSSPRLPPFPNPNPTVSMTDYAGAYEGESGTLTISERAGNMILETAEGEASLENKEADQFFVLSNSDMEVALLECVRDEQGRVIEIFHGNRWFRSLAYTGPTSFSAPEDWAAYQGLYWSHNPWGGEGGKRVVIRKQHLLVVDPISGSSTTLTPLGDATFIPGADILSPERISFDTVVEGRSLHMRVNNVTYYRSFNTLRVWADFE